MNFNLKKAAAFCNNFKEASNLETRFGGVRSFEGFFEGIPTLWDKFVGASFDWLSLTSGVTPS